MIFLIYPVNVLNSDIWKQKIINSSYSDKVIPGIPISYDVELYNPNNASVDWNTSGGIYLQQNSGGNAGECSVCVLTKDYIDIRNYTNIVMSGKLYVKYSNTSGYNPRIALLDFNSGTYIDCTKYLLVN